MEYKWISYCPQNGGSRIPCPCFNCWLPVEVFFPLPKSLFLSPARPSLVLQAQRYSTSIRKSLEEGKALLFNTATERLVFRKQQVLPLSSFAEALTKALLSPLPFTLSFPTSTAHAVTSPEVAVTFCSSTVQQSHSPNSGPVRATQIQANKTFRNPSEKRP